MAIRGALDDAAAQLWGLTFDEAGTVVFGLSGGRYILAADMHHDQDAGTLQVTPRLQELAPAGGEA